MCGIASFVGRVIVLLAFCVSLAGCSLVARVTGGFESPVIELEASKVESISLANTHLLFELVVHNPNAYSVTSHALRYRLMVGGAVVAEGTDDVTQTVPPNASASVNLPIDVRLDRLLNAAQGTTVLGEIPYDLDVWLSVDSWLRQREVHLRTSSALRMNLPIGLARAGVVAFSGAGWQS
jgi:LEA14-like dessication related protein